jgi:transcriptional regulator with XRE-family HTH domain
MTQKELAEALGVASNTVARYERDETGIPEPVARLVMLLHPKGKR